MNLGGFLQTLGTRELSFCLRAAQSCGPVLCFKSHPQQIIWLEEGPQGWIVGFSGPCQPRVPSRRAGGDPSSPGTSRSCL